MATATLTARDEAAGRLVVVDCPHGMSFGHYANAEHDPVQFTDAEIARALLITRYLTEGCACTVALRRKYGVSA
jgi:hypothetical protein